jgi:hypothetical protein
LSRGPVGGPETYARAVGRLARVGERGYHAFVPTIAPDPRDGLPIMVVGEDHDG